jgi:hypothetical protein
VEDKLPVQREAAAMRRNDLLFIAIVGQSVVQKQHFPTRLRSGFFQVGYRYIPASSTALAGLRVPRPA